MTSLRRHRQMYSVAHHNRFRFDSHVDQSALYDRAENFASIAADSRIAKPTVHRDRIDHSRCVTCNSAVPYNQSNGVNSPAKFISYGHCWRRWKYTTVRTVSWVWWLTDAQKPKNALWQPEQSANVSSNAVPALESWRPPSTTTRPRV